MQQMEIFDALHYNNFMKSHIITDSRIDNGFEIRSKASCIKRFVF